MTSRRFYLKKYLMFLLMILSVTVNAQKKFIIVLDAGHGGTDHGANRRYDETGYIAEKDITLAVTLKVGKMLEKEKDFKVIYTRKTDMYPSLTERTNIANRSKADLFVSIHVNSNKKTTPYGTETYVLGIDQNRTNLEVAKAENEVIFLDEKDKQTFASYDPTSPESLIALKIQQSKYRDASLTLASYIEENFEKKDKRYSRGVKQENFHVLRMNAMPSVLIEMGFVSNYDEALYISSDKGQEEISTSIYNGIMSYKKALDKKGGITEKPAEPEKPAEQPLKNDFRVLLMSSPTRYNDGDTAFKGLKYILAIKEGNQYKYYYANTNMASVRDNNVKTAKDAGFRNALAISFVPNQALATGFYTLEVAVTDQRLSSNSNILTLLKDVNREKIDGKFYYTYGQFKTLEDAIKEMKNLETKGIKNIVIQKKLK
ncbi:MAG: N-acetylmuramoyl-L-alanine amidase [Bergeyella sp.]